jgi:hypothetical protein
LPALDQAFGLARTPSVPLGSVPGPSVCQTVVGELADLFAQVGDGGDVCLPVR